MRTAILTLLFTGAFAVAAPVPEPTEAELKEKALKLNKETTNEEAATARLRELNKDKINTPKLLKVAAKLQKDAKEGEKPFRFYAALVLAKAAHFARDYDSADVFYDFCVDNAIKDLKAGKLITMAAIAQIDYFLARKQYPKAIKACERYLEIEDDTVQRQAMFVLEKKFRAMARNGDVDGALEELNLLLKRARGNVLMLGMKASILREAGKLDEAVATFKEVMEKIQADGNLPDDAKKLLDTSFRYSLSGVYTEQAKIEEAAAELEKLIKENPENPTFKNDLGFIWADNDMNMERAEKLIREAVEMDLASNKKLAEEGKLTPDQAKKANPAYIDSLGWVLYKNKKYEEALKHLLESAGADDEESDHIEIWDHVGDCYLALDKKKEALEAFQRGLKSEDVTKKDAERRRKVTEKINRLKKEIK